MYREIDTYRSNAHKALINVHLVKKNKKRKQKNVKGTPFAKNESVRLF